MRCIISGSISDFNPVFSANISKQLLILEKNGNLPLTVDTGFDGYIALPGKILGRMKLKYIAKEEFVLANGKTVTLKVYKGKVKIGDKIIESLFIPGDYLIGMRFLSQIGRKLIVELEEKRVMLLA